MLGRPLVNVLFSIALLAVVHSATAQTAKQPDPQASGPSEEIIAPVRPAKPAELSEMIRQIELRMVPFLPADARKGLPPSSYPSGKGYVSEMGFLKTKQTTIARTKTVGDREVSIIAYVDSNDGKLQRVSFFIKEGDFGMADHLKGDVSGLLVLAEPVEDETDKVGWNSVSLFSPEEVTHFQRGTDGTWTVRKYKNK